MDIVLHHNHDLCGIRGFLCSRQLSLEKQSPFVKPLCSQPYRLFLVFAMANKGSAQDGSASGDAAYS
jgi:hypothetical protein